MASVRLAIMASAALLLVGVQGSAHAAVGTRPLVIVDPLGDALPATHGDLTKLTITTGGTVKRGRYAPDRLVVQLDLSDAVDVSGGTRYQVDLSLPGCPGGFSVFANPGVPTDRGVTCVLADDGLAITMARGPKTLMSRLTWVVPFGDFPDGTLAAGELVRRVHGSSKMAGQLLNEDAQAASTGPSLDNDDVDSGRSYTIR